MDLAGVERIAGAVVDHCTHVIICHFLWGQRWGGL